jgi:hypothetical protein
LELAHILIVCSRTTEKALGLTLFAGVFSLRTVDTRGQTFGITVFAIRAVTAAKPMKKKTSTHWQEGGQKKQYKKATNLPWPKELSNLPISHKVQLTAPTPSSPRVE